MQCRCPKKSLSGLVLGLVSVPRAHAGDFSPDVSQLGDGLLALLFYVPAGLLLAALGLEILARRSADRGGLDRGVLTILVAATVASLGALAVSLAIPDRMGEMIGSPFGSLLTGAVFSCMTLVTCTGKWLSLRFSQTAATLAKPKAKKRRRGHGIPGRKVRGSKAGASRILLGFINCFYLGSLTAALGCLVASPMFIDSDRSDGSAPILAQEQTPSTEQEEPAPPNEPSPPRPEPATSTEIAESPEPKMVPEPEPEPAIVAKVEAEVTTPAPSEPDPEPVAIPEPGPTSPVPPSRPASDEKGGLAGAETYKQLIQPLLRNRCYDCHGAEKQKGDLRLDTPEGIRVGGKSGPAIIAGDPEKSYLFELINLEPSDDDIMPPKGKPLSAAQISWIGGWIREGAALGDGGSWPIPEGGIDSGLAIDSLTGDVAPPDSSATQALLDAGVIVRKLSSDGKLLEIDFSHADRAAGDLRLDELAPIAANIHTLDLKRTKITDADLQVLATMENLRILHLQRTKISDAAIAHLSGLDNLESLNLYNTKVSDACLPDLKKLTSLKKVFLWSTNVTPEGARDLASVLGTDVVNMGE